MSKVWLGFSLFLSPFHPLSKGWLHSFGSQHLFPVPFCPLSKGWLHSFIKSYVAFTCHCFFLLFSSASDKYLWQKVAPAGLFPLFHTCFSYFVVMGYTWMPSILSRLLAESLLCHLLRHKSLYSAGILLFHWGHTCHLSWSGTPSHPKHPVPHCGLFSI